MMEFRSDGFNRVASGGGSQVPDFSRHDTVKGELQALCDAHGGCGAVEAALRRILTPGDHGGLEGELRRLISDYGENLVLSEMKLLDPKNVSTWAKVRQRSWGPYEAGQEIAGMRGKNVDIRA